MNVVFVLFGFGVMFALISMADYIGNSHSITPNIFNSAVLECGTNGLKNIHANDSGYGGTTYIECDNGFQKSILTKELVEKYKDQFK